MCLCMCIVVNEYCIHSFLCLVQFRSTLSRALVEALNTFDLVNSDTRIGPLIKVNLISIAVTSLRLFVCLYVCMV